MFDETKAIKAGDLVKEADKVHFIESQYIFLTDSSANMTYSNFIQAINYLTSLGWEIGNVVGGQGSMYVLCKNPNYKPKNVS